ncbi:MAG: hypothetical protein PHR53_03865, partial [Bacteroidales bacterium]|nr:hypothetical protein [Bacteroidales bacterium]
MKKYTFFGLLFFSFFVFSLSAQEVLSSLETNPTIKQYLKKQPIIQKKAVVASPTLTLPFFDDFKYEGPYPDAEKWSDQYVFINTGFQKIPANRGVATFDALNEYGYVYDHATFTAFEADKLTSHKIRLDSLFGAIQRPLTIGDSLYLSFYFQPQGIGNKPEKDDIIELEFFVRDADTIFTIDSIYHEADTLWITDSTWMQIDSAYWEIDTTFVYYEEQWKTMWSSNGLNIDSFYLQNNTWMQHVMIPIIDPSDLRPDFRFRFKNYAS